MDSLNAPKIQTKPVFSYIVVTSVMLSIISCHGACVVQPATVKTPQIAEDSTILETTMNIMQKQRKQRSEWFEKHLSSFILTGDLIDFLQQMKAPYLTKRLRALKDTFMEKKEAFEKSDGQWTAMVQAFNEFRAICSRYLFHFDRLRNMNFGKPQELLQNTCVCADPAAHDIVTIYALNMSIESIYTIDPQERLCSAKNHSDEKIIWFLPYCLTYKVPRTLHVVCDNYIYEWIIPHLNIEKGVDVYIWADKDHPELDPVCKCAGEINDGFFISRLPLINKLQICNRKK